MFYMYNLYPLQFFSVLHTVQYNIIMHLCDTEATRIRKESYGTCIF